MCLRFPPLARRSPARARSYYLLAALATLQLHVLDHCSRGPHTHFSPPSWLADVVQKQMGSARSSCVLPRGSHPPANVSVALLCHWRLIRARPRSRHSPDQEGGRRVYRGAQRGAAAQGTRRTGGNVRPQMHIGGPDAAVPRRSAKHLISYSKPIRTRSIAQLGLLPRWRRRAGHMAGGARTPCSCVRVSPHRGFSWSRTRRPCGRVWTRPIGHRPRLPWSVFEIVDACRATQTPVQVAAKRMARQRVKGKIVFVSSFLGYMSIIGYSPYSPGKFAIRGEGLLRICVGICAERHVWSMLGLAETLQSELMLYGIDVHICFPGSIYSPGYEEENKTKPEITLKIEESDGGAKPDVVAEGLLRGTHSCRILV